MGLLKNKQSAAEAVAEAIATLEVLLFFFLHIAHETVSFSFFRTAHVQMRAMVPIYR
jgi:hypothetical protein